MTKLTPNALQSISVNVKMNVKRPGRPVARPLLELQVPNRICLKIPRRVGEVMA